MGTPPAPKPEILNVKANGNVKVGFVQSTTTELNPGPLGAVRAGAKFPAWTVSWEEPNWPCTSQGPTIIMVPVISQKPPAWP